MRLLGIVLVTVIIIAILRFAYLKDQQVENLFGIVNSDRVSHDLISKLPRDATAGDGSDTLHTFIVRESDTWTALAGSPGYSRVSFNLPKDVRVESGVMILDLSSELQVEGVARLRININGQRRGEIILEEGGSRHQVRINLLPSDLTQSQLWVTLGGFGRFPQMTCAQEWNGGMVLRIEPTSRVEITTSGPLRRLEDRLRATGNPYQMVWPDKAGVETRGRLLAFAADQYARGVRSEFHAHDDRFPIPVSFSEQDLQDAEDITKRPETLSEAAWPIRLADNGPNSAAQFFQYETDWKFFYDLRDTPNAELPTQFEFDVTLNGLDTTENWLLSVLLNGRSVFSEGFDGTVTRIKRKVRLDEEDQSFANTLTLKLLSSERRNSENCAQGIPVMAQLERATALHGGVQPEDRSLSDFINAVPSAIELHVSPDINAAEASTAVRFVDDAFGADTDWVPVAEARHEAPVAMIVSRREIVDRAAEILRTRPDRRLWFIWPNLPDESETPYGLMQVSGTDALERFRLSEGPRVAAFVSLPPLETDAASPSSAPAADDAPSPGPETPSPSTQSPAAAPEPVE